MQTVKSLVCEMMTFQYKGKKYYGLSAFDIVRSLESDATDYPHQGKSMRRFLLWSLESLCNRLPPRDLDLSDRMEDEALARNYLYLCDEYGIGKLSGKFENAAGERKNIAKCN